MMDSKQIPHERIRAGAGKKYVYYLLLLLVMACKSQKINQNDDLKLIDRVYILNEKEILPKGLKKIKK